MSNDAISGVVSAPYSSYALTSAGSAQPVSSGQGAQDAFQTCMQARLATQNRRIEDGVRNGLLTQDQAAQLFETESSIQNSLQNLESSGSTASQDQSQLLDLINQAGAQIFLAKHPEMAGAAGAPGDGSADASAGSSGASANQLLSDPYLSGLNLLGAQGIMGPANGDAQFASLLAQAGQSAQFTSAGSDQAAYLKSTQDQASVLGYQAQSTSRYV
jgi:hypothetical protein